MFGACQRSALKKTRSQERVQRSLSAFLHGLPSPFC